MKDGVYFDMPEEEYHALQRLSASGIKQLHITVEDFWARSWMNPRHEVEETDAMKFGSAYHKRILEGKEKFYQEYYSELDKADFGDELLVTSEDIKEELRKLELKISGKKQDLIDRLLTVFPDTKIWDELVDMNDLENLGKISLPATTIEQIEYAALFIERHPVISKAFQGGYPEVTVLWTDEATGVKMKSRFDYLKIAATVDLKTFSNSQQKAIHTAIHHAFGYNKYHTQMSVYKEARHRAIDLIKQGKVHGGDPEWLDKFVAKEDWKTMVVWQQTGIAPYTQAYMFRHDSSAAIAGENSMRECMMKFKECQEKFGTDPWLSMADIEEFEDEMLPYAAFE